MQKYSDADFEQAYCSTEHNEVDKVSLEEFNNIAGAISEALLMK
jgi:hypothetical protein